VIFLKYLSISALTIFLVKSVNLKRVFNIDPSLAHKKCLKYFSELEEARKLKNPEQEIESVNNYWDCYYDNLSNS
jgi:hypothetical protein